jgi:glyoxylase-like metal-dependent hydrolase (beta-lactamase superfamily II)
MIQIERILANNPGPFTGPGTNTWIADDGFGRLVIIDPGPVDPAHSDAIRARVAEREVVAVIVTHTHIDHAPMANPLARDLGVPALGHAAGPDFDPDVRLEEGSRVDFGEATLSVVHTPGHSDDHLCFRVGDLLFSGDHIMGGSSVMVEDMGPYLDSLEKLRGTGLARLYPGHGPEMEDPDDVIDWYLAHRRQRHEQIFEAIRAGAGDPEGVLQVVYADVDNALHPLALRSVLAHLALLTEQGRIAFDGASIVVAPPQAP